MSHHHRVIEAADGVSLHVEQWDAEGEPKFVVVVSHGAAEHVGRYAHMAERWNASGGIVIGGDHRGQGKSGGSKGHVDHFETFARDLRTVIETSAESLPESARPDKLPWFVFGHSMGGLIALVYLLDHERAVPLAGAMISAPLLEPRVKVGALKRFAANVAMTVAPKFAQPTGIPVEHISRDPAEVAAYAADPRRVDVLSAGWLRAMEAASTRVSAEADAIQLPMLWYAGTGDEICDHKATQRLHASLGDASDRKQTYREFSGYFHELHNEPAIEREVVLKMLDGWIETQRG